METPPEVPSVLGLLLNSAKGNSVKLSISHAEAVDVTAPASGFESRAANPQ